LTDTVRTAPAATPHTGQDADHAALTQTLETLMHFGALMLRAGNAAFRVRQWMSELARAMGIDALAVQIAIGGGMTATSDGLCAESADVPRTVARKKLHAANSH